MTSADVGLDGRGQPMTSDPALTLLREATCIDPSPDRLERIRRHAIRVDDWPRLLDQAEAHGLAPMLHRHLRTVDALPETKVRRILAALVARHRQANAALTETLIDIDAIFAELSLPFICLKGIALAHILYPTPALRPMRDIDLLVPIDRALEARDALKSRGFDASERYSGLGDGKFMQRHHHLPEVSIERHGLHVSVEIHTDAISGDSPGHLQFNSLREPPQIFHVNGVTLHALNHLDMMTHLIRHALEPAAETKLGSICDIVSYADRFHEQLDLPTLPDRCPWLANAIALIHYVSELPASLAALRPTAAAPTGAGFGPRPLGEIMTEHGVGRAAMAEASHPPNWWLHAYYGIEPGSPVASTRYFRHLPTLSAWLARRLWAATAKPNTPVGDYANREHG